MSKNKRKAYPKGNFITSTRIFKVGISGVGYVKVLINVHQIKMIQPATKLPTDKGSLIYFIEDYPEKPFIQVAEHINKLEKLIGARQ